MSNKENDRIIDLLEEASNEMLESLKSNELEQDEQYEWFGYIRGLRDFAYEFGILNKTNLQEYTTEALKIVQSKQPCSAVDCNKPRTLNSHYCQFHNDNLPF